ncbi:hypothetical protein D3C76_920960 [compost metagenome]
MHGSGLHHWLLPPRFIHRLLGLGLSAATLAKHQPAQHQQRRHHWIPGGLQPVRAGFFKRVGVERNRLGLQTLERQQLRLLLGQLLLLDSNCLVLPFKLCCELIDSGLQLSVLQDTGRQLLGSGVRFRH